MFRTIAASAAVLSSVSAVHTWSYEKKAVDGPDTWADNFPSCGGRKQSPVNIKNGKAEAKRNKRIPNLEWTFGAPETVTVTNNGRYVTITDIDNPTILGDGVFGLEDEFQLNHIELHWKRSEHKINGDRKKGEIHFVHYNTNNDPAINPYDQYNGVAIVAGLIQRGKKNKELLPMTDLLPTISDPGAPVNFFEVDNFDIEELAPKKVFKNYYTYEGSQTHPPCREGVTWIVGKRYTKLSNSQLKQFDTLLDPTGQLISDNPNAREIQNLNARAVFRSFGYEDEDDKLLENLLSGNDGDKKDKDEDSNPLADLLG